MKAWRVHQYGAPRDVLQLDDVDELVRLPAQLVGHHRWLCRDGRYYRYPNPTALHRLDQRAKIAVAGEQHHLVDMLGDLPGVDRKLDIHVAFDLAAAGLIDKLLGCFGDDSISVVIEPIY